jgi:hypothetical protein
MLLCFFVCVVFRPAGKKNDAHPSYTSYAGDRVSTVSYRSYAVARQVGGLEGHPEGTRPSKTLFFPPDWAALPPSRAGRS